MKILIPERLPVRDGLRRLGNAGPDFFKVPSFWENLAEAGALEGAEHVHEKKPPCVKSATYSH